MPTWWAATAPAAATTWPRTSCSGRCPGTAATGYRTAIPGLYLTGAATWPGAGNNAVSGVLAARRVLWDFRFRRWDPRARAGSAPPAP